MKKVAKKFYRVKFLYYIYTVINLKHKNKNKMENQNTMTQGMMLKSDVVNALKLELSDCRQRNQRTVWTFWHYGMQQPQYADTNTQFRQIKDAWTMQGFKFSQKREYPEMALMIGARSVTAHIWKNVDRTEFNSESTTEFYSPMLGYLNAGNEVVTWEINL